MAREPEIDDLAIIGGGFAGASVAVACAQHARHARVLLFAPEPPGQGAAYGPSEPLWFMNGPARAMSCIAGDPEHLVRTLQCRPDEFLTRARFGAYVTETLRTETARTSNVVIERRTVVDIERRNADFVLEDDRGTRFRARNVVLAVGNAKPPEAFLPTAVRNSKRYFGDPWRTPTSALPHGDMLCIGNGLTAIDRVAAYAASSQSGTAYTIGRHRFLPAREDAEARACNYAPLCLDERSPLNMLRSVRSAMQQRVAQGGDWREVAEALRRPSQRIWQSWTLVQRRQFVEHLASLWGSLRYRVPPLTDDAVATLRASGRYIALHGTLVDASEVDNGILIAFRAGGELRSLRVASVVNCTGPNGDLRSDSNPLLRALLARGLIRPDALHLGIDATPYGEAIDSEGLADERLFVLGPPLRGVLYETTAVPEIAEQARAIARRVACRRESCVA